jgi:hypothetical protein
VPSGLFPSGQPRPVSREPHPVRMGGILAGAGACAMWLLLVGLFAGSVRGYVWLTLFAAAVAWLCATILVRFGDRGVAVGVALVGGLGISIAVLVVIGRWASTGWPLW